MVTHRHVEKVKKKILIEKLRDASIATASFVHPFISDYYTKLSRKFDRVILRYMDRANNGFKYLSLEEKLQTMNKIKPTIDRLARLNSPNNPHVGVAKELAEDTFYKIMEICKPILEEEYSFV